jgi:hypothetical protein
MTKRAIVTAPMFDGRRMFERLPEDSKTLRQFGSDAIGYRWAGRQGVRQWHLRLAPRTYVIVTQSERSHWRVSGIESLDTEHTVAGGPQRAANAAATAVRNLAKTLLGAAA